MGPQRPEHTAKVAKANKGKHFGPRTAESRIKQSIANKGKAQAKITCPHCGKVGGTTMHRWHFDNCKSRPAAEEVAA